MNPSQSPARKPFAASVAICAIFFSVVVADLLKTGRWEIIFIFSFFTSVTARLCAETYGLDKIRTWVCVLSSVALTALATYLLRMNGEYSAHIFGIFCFASMFVLPFLRRDSTDEGFWNFNYSFWSLLGIGLFISILFFASGAAIFGILGFLTKIKMPYEDLFIFTATIFGPVFVLAHLPENTRAPEIKSEKLFYAQCQIQSFLVIPLFLIYSAILYVYAGTIVAQWKLPDGGLAYYVMGFGIVGMVCYFAAYGFEKSREILGFFRKYFFPLLALPVLLFALAVGRRIHAYGVTEDRYVLAAFCLFLLLASVIHYTKWRVKELRVISALLLAFLAVASFGPLSASYLSQKSQEARLMKLVEKYNLAPSGKFAPPKTDLTFADQKELSSIIQYLWSRRKTALLDRMAVKPELKDKDLSYEYRSAAPFMQRNLGLSYINDYTREQDAPFLAGEPVQFTDKNFDRRKLWVTGFDYALTVNFYTNRQPWKQTYQLPIDAADKNGGKPLYLSYDDNTGLLVARDDRREWARFDLKQAMGEIPSGGHFILVSRTPSPYAELLIGNLNGASREKDNTVTLQNMNGQLYIRLIK